MLSTIDGAKIQIILILTNFFFKLGHFETTQPLFG